MSNFPRINGAIGLFSDEMKKMRTFHTNQESAKSPGNGVTSDPVAIMMFFVLTTSTMLPSGPMTDTSLAPVILPWPGTIVEKF